jgi:hypothetical protein
MILSGRGFIPAHGRWPSQRAKHTAWKTPARLPKPQRRPLFGQAGAETGSILPAASCNSPKSLFGLIRGAERCQIANPRDVKSLNKRKRLRAEGRGKPEG